MAITCALLFLFPPAFRRELGSSLVRDVRDRATSRWRRGRAKDLAFWLARHTLSMLQNAGCTWLEAVRGQSGTGPADRRHMTLCVAFLATLGRETLVAVRSLVRAPSFTGVVVATLALGLGGTIAVFTIFKAVLLDPLPYTEPDRLVRLYQYDDEDPALDLPVTAPHFIQYRDRAAAFEVLATVYTLQEAGATIVVNGRPERVRRVTVSSGYFDVLRASPLEGRTFDRNDETGPLRAVVSERLVGRVGGLGLGDTIRLDAEAYTVIGVMPEGLRDPISGVVDVWVPQDLHGGGAEHPGNHFLSVIGRLAPGVEVEQALHEMQALDRTLAGIYPEVADDGAFRLVDLHADRVAQARVTLVLLFGATLLVLLIACINVANLLLVRSLERGRQMELRSALGATRIQIAWHGLAESLVLAALGGAAGLVTAWGGLQLLMPAARDVLPAGTDASMDGGVLLFASCVTLSIGLVLWIVPVVPLMQAAPGALGFRCEGGRVGPPRSRGRAALVALQVSAAMVLLVGASALTAGMHRLSGMDLGFRSESIATFQLDLPAARYDTQARIAFHRALASRLVELPGVRQAAAVNTAPAAGRAYVWGTRPVTGPRADDGSALVDADQRVVAGRYFETMDIPLVEGRLFGPGDDHDAPGVVVVSESLAAAIFPGVSPLGHSVRMSGIESRIVGVVRDVAADAAGSVTPHVYHPHAQLANRAWPMTYLVSGAIEPEDLVAAVGGRLRRIDAELVPYGARSHQDRIRQERAVPRFRFLLMAWFAGVAVALACLGLYGLLAHLVSSRGRELAVRLALGADGRRIAGIIVARAAAVVVPGMILGLAGSSGLGRVLSPLSLQADPIDSGILAVSAVLLLVVGSMAAALPAARALMLSPRAVLKEE